MTNPYDEDLVYLMGGEHSGFDIGAFPKIGKTLIFTDGSIRVVDDKNIESIGFDRYLPDGMPEASTSEPKS